MKYSAEFICSMVTNNLSFPKIIYQKATKLLVDLMDIIVKDNNLISENLSILRKMMIIPKKLTDPAYCKDTVIKENLLELMKSNLLMLRDMNEIGIRNRTNLMNTKYNREFPDFVKNTIVNCFI